MFCIYCAYLSFCLPSFWTPIPSQNGFASIFNLKGKGVQMQEKNNELGRLEERIVGKWRGMSNTWNDWHQLKLEQSQMWGMIHIWIGMESRYLFNFGRRYTIVGSVANWFDSSDSSSSFFKWFTVDGREAIELWANLNTDNLEREPNNPKISKQN